MQLDMQAIQREILLGFWKVHILHHAAEGPVVGLWMLHELQHHGYDVSPGTLYPLLRRMERRGWLKSETDKSAGPRARREYHLTPMGHEVLKVVRKQLNELRAEVG